MISRNSIYKIGSHFEMFKRDFKMLYILKAHLFSTLMLLISVFRLSVLKFVLNFPKICHFVALLIIIYSNNLKIFLSNVKIYKIVLKNVNKKNNFFSLDCALKCSLASVFPTSKFRSFSSTYNLFHLWCKEMKTKRRKKK